MQDHEMKIATKLVDHLLATGHLLSVHDGEEVTVKNSTDKAAIIDALATTDEDTLIVRDGAGKHLGSVYLVYGNEPGVLICDYNVSLESLLEPVNAYAETLEE